MILTVFLGALLALIWFYFNNNTSQPAPIVYDVNSDVYDPFGTKNLSAPIVATTSLSTDNSSQGNFISTNRLQKISEEPVSGFSLNEDKEKKLNIHYILRSNGNIYEKYEDLAEAKRLSNTTVPKVYESFWLPGGEKLIIRYLREKTENIQTFSVKINPATTTTNEFEGGIDGNFLPENITALAVNPLGDKIFYLTFNLNGSSGFISKPDGLNKKLLFESPLIEWNVSWPKEEIITMATRPSAIASGYLYFLNSQDGTFSKILGNIRGLTTKTNSQATEVLYSDSSRNSPRLYILNIKKKESKLLPWNTLPEKCAWSNLEPKIVYCAVPKTIEAGAYPDIWYQGLTNFNDDIWSVNTETGATNLVYDIQKETQNNIDAISLQVDKKDNSLFFINKTDLSLWKLNLK